MAPLPVEEMLFNDDDTGTGLEIDIDADSDLDADYHGHSFSAPTRIQSEGIQLIG